MLYEPFEDHQIRENAAEELLKLCADAMSSRREAMRQLFAEFDAGSLRHHRTRVVHAVFAAFDDMDAIYPALWIPHMEGRVKLDEFRVMRDDFAARKSLYQDLFELGSRTLAFTAPIANLALRGDARSYSDQESRSLNKARRTTAFRRAEWLVDFPLAEKLYTSVSRNTRNDIGHTLVHHDAANGLLVYEDGSEENYLLFLLDSLAALRLSHYLLDVVQILDYTRIALRSMP